LPIPLMSSSFPLLIYAQLQMVYLMWEVKYT